MKERLQKILSARGVASRRSSEELIRQGRVTVNGTPAALGDSADPERDEILLDGLPLPKRQECVYIMLNKPRGYVTTLSDERGRPDAARLVADCGVRVYPVGRLDMDSEGLLLFTNDGEFANRMMHPRGIKPMRCGSRGIYAGRKQSWPDPSLWTGTPFASPASGWSGPRGTGQNSWSPSTKAATARCGGCVKPPGCRLHGFAESGRGRFLWEILEPGSGVT